MLRRATRRVPRGRTRCATCPPPTSRSSRRWRPSRRASRRPGGLDVPEGLRDVERAAVEAAQECCTTPTAGGLPTRRARRWPAGRVDLDADVVVVGGGYTGLWTAWEVAEASRTRGWSCPRPSAAGRARAGATAASSPRSGSTAAAARQYGEARARELCEASVESVLAVGAWCEAQEVDAWYREAPHLVLPCAPAPDGASVRLCRRPRGCALDAPPRRERSATRRSSAPVWRPGRARRGTRRGSPSGCASACSGAAADLRALAGARAALRRRASRAPAVVVETDAAPCGGRGRGRRQRRRRAAHPAAQPPHRLLEPHRADRAGPGRHRGARLDRRRGDHATGARCCTTSAPPGTGASCSAGAAADGRGRAHGRAHGRRPGHRRPDAREPRRIFPALAGRRIDHAWAGRSTSPPPTCPRSSRCSGGRRRRRSATPATASGLPTWPRARSPRSARPPRRRRALGLDRPAAGARAPSRCGSRGRRCCARRSPAARPPPRPATAPTVSEALAALPAKLGLHIVR